MSNIIDLAKADFDREVMQSDIPVVLDFSAVWCGPCKALLPALEDVAKVYKDQVKVVKVDIDVHPEIARQYNVMGVPTLIGLNKGADGQRFMGNRTRSELSAMMDSLIEGAR